MTDSEDRDDYQTDDHFDESSQPFLSEKEFIDEPEDLGFIQKWRFFECSSLLIFTCIQVFNPILVRVSHKESAKHGVTFLGSTTVLATEILKTVLCILIPLTYRSPKRIFRQVYDSFTINKLETLKICVPALVFVIQNNLYYFALQRIDSIIFSMTYQLRILTTALLSMIILSRRFSYLQWMALLMSLFGAVTVQLGGSHVDHSQTQSSTGIGLSDQVSGLSAVLIMCFTNAFGGVYLEAVMKKSNEEIWLQNIRLSLISLPMAAATMFSDYETIETKGFFVGWNNFTYFIVLVGACGGIIVSCVIRHADNIKKSFCQALALGGTAFVSVYLGDSDFSIYLLLGVSTVVVSVLLYAMSPNKLKRERVASYDQRVYEEGTSEKSAQLV